MRDGLRHPRLLKGEADLIKLSAFFSVRWLAYFSENWVNQANQVTKGGSTERMQGTMSFDWQTIGTSYQRRVRH